MNEKDLFITVSAAGDLAMQGARASVATVLTYRKISNISHTKFQDLNVSRLVLSLSLSNPLKPGVKSRMKM